MIYVVDRYNEKEIIIPSHIIRIRTNGFRQFLDFLRHLTQRGLGLQVLEQVRVHTCVCVCVSDMHATG